MRRTKRLIAPLLLAAAAACSDGVVSSPVRPIEAPSAAPAPISFAPQGRPTLSLNGGLPDSAAADFYVGPNGGVFFVGNNAVVFPSQSVCDPATSGYGPSTWDLPCTTLQTPLKVHAEVRRSGGQTWVDFTPSLRFAPSSYPSRWVWMAMYTPEAIGSTTDVSRFNVLWASSIGGVTVDESLNDPSMRTYVDTFSGIAIRRIKHFSGYMYSSGRDCGTGSECGGGESGGTP
jgi:hypothetical protein